MAARYEESSSVQADGDELKDIADRESVGDAELVGSTSNIAAACGKPPLNINAVIGG